MAPRAPAAEPHHEVQGGAVMDAVGCQGAGVLKLPAGKDQPLLVRRDACNNGVQAT